MKRYKFRDSSTKGSSNFVLTNKAKVKELIEKEEEKERERRGATTTGQSKPESTRDYIRKNDRVHYVDE